MLARRGFESTLFYLAVWNIYGFPYLWPMALHICPDMCAIFAEPCLDGFSLAHGECPIARCFLRLDPGFEHPTTLAVLATLRRPSARKGGGGGGRCFRGSSARSRCERKGRVLIAPRMSTQLKDARIAVQQQGEFSQQLDEEQSAFFQSFPSNVISRFKSNTSPLNFLTWGRLISVLFFWQRLQVGLVLVFSTPGSGLSPGQRIGWLVGRSVGWSAGRPHPQHPWLCQGCVFTGRIPSITGFARTRAAHWL